MNRLTVWSACLGSAALIAACGGGGDSAGGTASGGTVIVPNTSAQTPQTPQTTTPTPTPVTTTPVTTTPVVAIPVVTTPVVTTPVVTTPVVTTPVVTTPVVVTPAMTPLAMAKAAAASAPINVASIPTRAGPAPTLLPSGDAPPWSYQRYFISGAGTNNGSGVNADNARLDTVAYIYNFAKWLKLPPGVTNNINDGSKADYWATGADYGGSQAYIGIRTNSRYVAMPSQSFCGMSLIVDGRTIVPGINYTANNQYAVWDLSTNEERNLVFVGCSSAWISEVVIQDGAKIAPYNFLAEKPVTISFTGDSYLGHSAIRETGMSFVDMQARLLGALATTATHVGGTGYRADIEGDILTRGSSAPRMARFTEAKPTIMIVELGINDPWPGTGPTTLEAMRTVLQGARAANPDSVLVAVGPWEPNESDARDPNGSDRAVVDAISTTLQGLTGPWVLLDNIRGNWKTSAGTTRSSLRGPWQTGEGNAGAPTGVGNGDTWLNADGVHPSTPVGITGLAEVLTTELRAALASM